MSNSSEKEPSHPWLHDLVGFAPRKVLEGDESAPLVEKHFQMTVKPPQGWHSYTQSTIETTRHYMDTQTLILFEWMLNYPEQYQILVLHCCSLHQMSHLVRKRTNKLQGKQSVLHPIERERKISSSCRSLSRWSFRSQILSFILCFSS